MNGRIEKENCWISQGLNFTAACDALKTVIGTEALRFSFLEESAVLSENDRKMYRQLTTVGTPETGLFDMPMGVLTLSLKTLSALLHKHYDKQVILLIDEL